MELAIFLLLAAIATVTGLMVVLMRNPVHSALFLVLCFLQIAALFILLGAEFLAMIQIIVYTGAILVLFVFVVLLLQIRRGPSLPEAHRLQPFLAPVAGILLLGELILIISTGITVGQQGQFSLDRIVQLGGNTRVLGQVLYTQYLFPFEIASLILLVAALGAVVLAKRNLEREGLEVRHARGLSLAGKVAEEREPGSGESSVADRS
jgi:NADH-quinone oxidoreductase subunit J